MSHHLDCIIWRCLTTDVQQNAINVGIPTTYTILYHSIIITLHFHRYVTTQTVRPQRKVVYTIYIHVYTHFIHSQIYLYLYPHNNNMKQCQGFVLIIMLYYYNFFSTFIRNRGLEQTYHYGNTSARVLFINIVYYS